MYVVICIELITERNCGLNFHFMENVNFTSLIDAHSFDLYITFIFLGKSLSTCIRIK